ncbi:MAG: helix-turn-helix domain-containing protein [Burkholderiaceae bacterium]
MVLVEEIGKRQRASMTARNKLLAAPPYAVEKTLGELGANLRTARLRRNLTIGEMAEKIGTGVRAVADAEKGKPSTGIAVYAALLWALGLLDQLDVVASPERDEEGQMLALARERLRARPKTELSNDF